jgi:AcrR family transcriptional regulator
MEKEREKRGRGRPQTLDRQRTVEVAMTSFWCDGVRDVSMNEICRRAHVSKPGVYREFGNEDGLMEAAVELYRRTVVTPLLDAFALNQPFWEVLDFVLHAVTEPSGKPAGCLVAELRSAPSGLGSATAAKVSAVAEEMRHAYEQWFRRAQARGEVDATVSPVLAAHFIDTQLTSVLLQMRLRTDPELVRAQAHLAFRALHRAGPGRDSASPSVEEEKVAAPPRRAARRRATPR